MEESVWKEESEDGRGSTMMTAQPREQGKEKTIKGGGGERGKGADTRNESDNEKRIRERKHKEAKRTTRCRKNSNRKVLTRTTTSPSTPSTPVGVIPASLKLEEHLFFLLRTGLRCRLAL